MGERMTDDEVRQLCEDVLDAERDVWAMKMAKLRAERDEAIAERDKARGRADYLQASLDAERLMR